MTLVLIAGSIQAAEPTRREQLCDLEEKLSIKESRVYREGLRWGTSIDNYANIKDRVDPLQVKARAIVKDNCLKGKPSSEISAQLTTLWTEGCAPIVNPTLHPICKAFQALNDGTNVAKLSIEIPALATLLKSPPSSDCTAGVSEDTSSEEATATELSDWMERNAVGR